VSLVDKVIAGDVGVAARLISRLEDSSPDAFDEMEDIYSHTGKAHIVGITGAPGVGKSTLTDNLVSLLRGQKKTVGVVAIDPTSALTGGALLGDRVRMQRHSTDAGVFIRSLATRGWTGGLAKAAIGAVHVMDAMGKDVVIVETVGSGQVEINIVRATDTTIVILTPGMGDDIQMMKAGILEVADILVVNKADLEGADRLKAGLEALLAMKEGRQNNWIPPVVMTVALNDEGTDELMEAIKKHRDFLLDRGEVERRRRDRAKLEILESVEGVLRDHIHRLEGDAYLEKLAGEMIKGRMGPSCAAMEIAGKIAAEIKKSIKQE
jgi:LAO/AO transport system kinase